jgi:hypothetical protein
MIESRHENCAARRWALALYFCVLVEPRSSQLFPKLVAYTPSDAARRLLLSEQNPRRARILSSPLHVGDDLLLPTNICFCDGQPFFGIAGRFDFAFEPSLDRYRVMALAGLDFSNRAEKRLLHPARRARRNPRQGGARRDPAREDPLPLPGIPARRR